jgi:cytochrome c oxidase subunit 4
MSSEPTEVHHAESEHGETLTKRGIVKVLLILLAITAIEFLIALYLAPHYKTIKEYANPAYIVLTLFKAYYIVAFFMHLKFEKVGLLYAILVPILFIIGLILVLTNESHHWIHLRG